MYTFGLNCIWYDWNKYNVNFLYVFVNIFLVLFKLQKKKIKLIIYKIVII